MLLMPDGTIHYHSVADPMMAWCRTLVFYNLRGALTEPLNTAPTCFFCIYKDWLVGPKASWFSTRPGC